MADQVRKIVLVYIGRRVIDREKAQVDFGFMRLGDLKKKDPKILFFGKVKWLSVGDKIEAEDRDGSTFIKTAPEVVGSVDDEDLVLEWRVRDEHARDYKNRARKSKAAENLAAEVVKHPERLRRVLRQMSYLSRRYFVEALIEEYDKLEKKGG